MDLEPITSSTGELRKSGHPEERVQRPKKTSLRKLHLIIDFSQVMLEKDFPPSLIHAVLVRAIEFVQEFLELNPLSNIALSFLRDRKCDLLCNFKSSPNEIIEILEKYLKKNSISEDKFIEDVGKENEKVNITDIPNGKAEQINPQERSRWKTLSKPPSS